MTRPIGAMQSVRHSEWYQLETFHLSLELGRHPRISLVEYILLAFAQELFPHYGHGPY